MRKQVFFALALGAMIASCSSNEELGMDQAVSKAGSYLTLQIEGPQATTRTLAEADGTEVGTAVENKISSVKILLCDPSDHSISQQYTISAGLIETQNGVKTLPIKVDAAGTYELYVIANPGSLAPTNATTATFAVTEATMKSTFAADNTFLMFNENNTSAVAGTSITITEDNDYDHPATCDAIKLDRLAAQVRSANAETVDITKISDSSTGEFPSITAMTLVGFRLMNGATTSNLQQKWTQSSNVAGTLGWKNNLITPAIALGSYYNNLADFRVAESSDNGDGTVTYTDVRDLYSNISAYNGETGNIYCMENNSTWDATNSEIIEALKGNTTGLVYQWQATVTGSDELQGANTFYGYEGQYFPTLEAIQVAYPSVFIKADISGDTSTDPENVKQLNAAKAELQAAADEAGISAFRTKYLIKVYKGGIVYYTYYIKDKNYEQLKYESTTESENYYAVMRNTIYNLKVTALQRVGTDIPGGWNPEADPDDPVDEKNMYMVVETTVKPWVLSNSEITLK